MFEFMDSFNQSAVIKVIGVGGGGLVDPNQAVKHKLDFKMIHFDTETDLVVRTRRQWYWKHTVGYECLWREDSTPGKFEQQCTTLCYIRFLSTI